MPKTPSRSKQISLKNTSIVSKNTLPVYTVFTDGSWRPPSYGAYAVVILKDNADHACLSGPIWNCTINQMELMAIYKALSFFSEQSHVTVISDSQYAINCITKWVYSWRLSNWITSTGDPVKNRDLIEKIYNLCQVHDVKFKWVRGHSGDKHNEQCDKIAQAITKAMQTKQLLPPIT